MTGLLRAGIQVRDSVTQQAALLPGNWLNGPSLLRPVPPLSTKALTWFSKSEGLLRFDANGKLAGAYASMTDAVNASGLPSWHRQKLVNAMKSSREQLAYDCYWLVLGSDDDTQLMAAVVALTPAGATTVPTDTGFWSKVMQRCSQATASRDAESVKRHYQRQLVGTCNGLLPCGTAKPAAQSSGKKRRAAAAAADSSDSDCDVRHYGH
jgi:hypothetical protein